jgi:hypothetical protein
MNMNCSEAVPGAIHDHDTFIGQSMCDCIDHDAIMNLTQISGRTAAV